MAKYIFGTDPHGNRLAYERLFSIASQEQLSVILGGDLTPKLVAVKIDDEDGKVPSKVIPLDLVQPSSEHQTYTDSLQKIQKLNQRFTPEDLTRDLQERGYIIHTVTNGIGDISAMLEENIVLDRLAGFFQQETMMQRRHYHLSFTKDEKLSLEMLIDLIRDIEQDFPNSQKRSLRESWIKFLQIDPPELHKYPYERLALSINLSNYILYRGKVPEAQTQHQRLLAQIESADPGIRELYAQALTYAVDNVILAEKLMESVYTPAIFNSLNLGEQTTIMYLKNQSSKLEVVQTGQQRFVEEYLQPRLSQFKAENKELQVYAILGNDDMAKCEDNMRALHQEGLLTYLSNSVAQLPDGLQLVGYPYIRKSEKSFYNAWEKSEEAITADLERLATQTDPRSTIWVVHNPPFGTTLDWGYEQEHLGCKALTEFILKHQPLLTLHGHIHESPQQSGQFSEMIGTSMAVNPGSLLEYSPEKDNFNAVTFDPRDLTSMCYLGNLPKQ